MESVGLREANVNFTSYITKVRAGAEIILTDRGVPIAIIKPITPAVSPLKIRLKQLEDAGMLRLAKNEFTLTEPVSCKGCLISETVSEERRERC